jgi:hypothetical protein
MSPLADEISGEGQFQIAGIGYHQKKHVRQSIAMSIIQTTGQ